MAHVLGYVGPVSEQELNGDPLLELPEFQIGKNGIEKTYDEALRGRPGLSRFEVNALGREIKELYHQDGEPGEDLTLTIDLDLQRYVHERLGSEESASAVVLDVATGDVLALASVPSFDPSAFSNGLSPETWRDLTTNVNAPLVDKAIAGQYPPGSTFKMMVALAALEAGVTTPDYEVYCPGYLQLGDHQFHCWKRWGHGQLAPGRRDRPVLRRLFLRSCPPGRRRCDRGHGASVRPGPGARASTCPASGRGWCRTRPGSSPAAAPLGSWARP